MSLKYQTDEEVSVTGSNEGDQVDPFPVPVYTYIFLVSIAAVAVTQFATDLDESIALAGFVKPAFVVDHQYWRILTGATLHASVFHVLMNGYAFYSFGRIFEFLSNRAHLAIVFLLSAIGGGLLSLLFVPNGTSVGASGGIVGLIGYLAVYAFRRRQFISAEFRKNLLVNIGFLLVFGLILYRVIDNFGHLGGLITGGVYGLLQIPSDPTADPRDAGKTAQVFGLISLGVYIAGCIFSILLITQAI